MISGKADVIVFLTLQLVLLILFGVFARYDTNVYKARDAEDLTRTYPSKLKMNQFEVCLEIIHTRSKYYLSEA